MKSGLIRGKLLVGAAVVAAALASGNAALAHDEAEGQTHEAGAAAHHGAGHGEKHHAAEHEDHDWHFWVDMVLGSGKGPIAIQTPPTSGAVLPGYTVGNSKVTSESFIVGGALKVTKNFSLGVRVPFTLGSFFPVENNSRGTTALGNIEIEGEYEKHLSHNVAMAGILGISLPTAQGVVLPEKEQLESLQNLAVDQNGMDRYALNRAAALSRGSEDNALYEVRRFGINPKIAFDIKAAEGKIVISPYLKMENLIATGDIPYRCGSDGKSSCNYLGELVPGLGVRFRAHKHFTPALRFWANIAFAGVPKGEEAVSAALEPQLIFPVANVQPMIGVIIPVAGPAKVGGDTPAVGVRFALGAKF